jgi:hypothetical protein
VCQGQDPDQAPLFQPDSEAVLQQMAYFDLLYIGVVMDHNPMFLHNKLGPLINFS